MAVSAEQSRREPGLQSYKDYRESRVYTGKQTILWIEQLTQKWGLAALMQLIAEQKMTTAMEVRLRRWTHQFRVCRPSVRGCMNQKKSTESSCQKYLGVVIIDRLQIVYIKINRHHKFLVHILIGPMGFIYSTGQWSKYFVTDQDLLISLLQRLFFIFTSDLELFDATLQLRHSTNSHLTAFLGRLLNRKYKDQWNFYCLHFCQN